MAQTIGKGATITLPALFTDGAGDAVDPDDPKVSILDNTGATVVSLATPTRVSLGHWEYQYPVPIDAAEGAWAAVWFATINGSPLSDEDGFTVVAAGSITTGDSGEGLTCTPWATSDDAPLSLMQYGVDPADVDDAFQMAGDILYELTGRRWPGICSDTIRPCAKYYATSGPPRWWSAMGGYSSQWGWCSCNRGDACGCSTIPQIKLPGNPVDASSIVVKVDGLDLDSTAFRLDDHRYLVRVDGDGWPCCQNLRLADSEERTWSVAYSYGSMPDIGGIRSAVLLGTSLYGDLFPEEAARCKVPARARTITRQGTTYDLGDVDAMMEHGITGIAAVDLWIASKNLGRQRRPATVVIPGISRLARRVGA